MHYIYFAKSLKNGKIYVGRTEKDPVVRVKEHNSNSNTWSSQNKPLELVYFESYFCSEDAVAREKFYKMGVGKKVKYAIVERMNS